MVAALSAKAQYGSYHFHKLGTSQGLSGGLIRDFGEDKYGFIWIATIGGLNRFDGKNVQTFSHNAKDTTSPLNSQPRCFFSDAQGRFFIGFETGMMQYNFRKMKFNRMQTLQNLFIRNIIDFSTEELLVHARSGLYKYNTKTNALFNYSQSNYAKHLEIQNSGINDLCKLGHQVFFATKKGLIVLDTKKDEFKAYNNANLLGKNIKSVCTDLASNIWISGEKYLLAKLNPMSNEFSDYSKSFLHSMNKKGNNVSKIQSDSKGNIWLATEGDGIFLFTPADSQVQIFTHNTFNNSSPSVNTFQTLFKSKSGMLWFGSDIDEINFLNPSENSFSTIYPFPDREQGYKSKMGRAITIDHDGNYWMGNHDGLSKYNPKTKQYTVWRNSSTQRNILYSNIIRSLCCDHENNIWIGTGSGVNKYLSATGKMEFISAVNLPPSFYNSINEDKSGNIWFCTTDSASLYWYNFKEKKFRNISSHPQLKKYAGYTTTSYVFEDSKERLWISITRKGLLMLNKTNGKLLQFKAKEGNTDSLIGNMVIDIKEDHNGNIWASTFSGVTCIHDNNTITHYTQKNGLGGTMCSGIIVDKHNRIWIGANGGLTMIDSLRENKIIYRLGNGLNSVGFPEHAAVMYKDEIVFPSYNGYIAFNINDVANKQSTFPYYVAGFNVVGDEMNILSEENSDSRLSLAPRQSSFTFHIVALNYNNPSNTWYAYKLQGFESVWHYTQDPKAVYTNVQGGHYTFLYKASNNNNQWNTIPTKSLSLHLKTYFYKTWWFKLLGLLLFLGGVYWLFKYRTQQQQRVYTLVEKTQALEKEKAMAMYENLKQQLNPHFLFNSLTSLNSLIEIEPQKASEFLESLSKTYRYILKSRDSDLVSLGDEVKFAETYVQLQKTRFEKGFQVIFDIPDDYYSYKIAPVTIQNLIENAIKHNIIDDATPLQINIYTENDNLIVENNMQKKSFVESSNKQGLVQMQNLYQHLSPRPLQIHESAKKFTVIIPLI